MKHIIMMIAITLTTALTLTAAPYGSNGRPGSAIGENGQKIPIRVYGDEFFQHAEDANGYTIVFDNTLNTHCYATLNATGDELVSTGKVIGTVSPARLGLAKSLRISPDSQRVKARAQYEATSAKMTCEKNRLQAKIRDLQLNGASQDVIDSFSSLYQTRYSDISASPTMAPTDDAQNSPPTSTTTGAVKGVLILVNFPDNSTQPFSIPQFYNFCNQTGYNEFGNTGSVKDYFQNQSRNQFTYENTVVGYVTMDYNRSYYDDDVSYTDDGRRGSHKLVREAVTKAMANLTATQISQLTDDSTGRIRGVNIMYTGTAVFNKALWPHRHLLIRYESGQYYYDPVTIAGGKHVLDYQMTDIGETGQLAVGTFCHESGHLICGFGDYYDYGYDSSGVGSHCLMGGGNGNNGGRTPAGINCYLRYKAGWLSPTTLSGSGTGSLNASLNQAYIFRKSSTEYFMIENRQKSQKWDAYLKDQGLMIWHVDEAQPNNDDQNHYELDLEQADGNRDLNLYQNSGDSTDYFDNNTPNFSGVTSPNSNWYDTAGSNLNMSSISAVGTTMTFSFATVPGGGGTPDLRYDSNATISATSVVQGGAFSMGLDVLSANAASGSHTTTFYFSTDATITTGDYVLDSYVSSGISTNSTETQSVSAATPAGIPPGVYRVGCIIDSTNSVSESDEANNVILYASSITVTATGATYPDLKDDGSSWHTLSATTVTQTTSFNMGLDVRCADLPATAHTTYFYFSADTTITGGDYLIGGYSSNGISAGNWETQSTSVQNFPLSVPPGIYYVGCIIDAGGAVTESNEVNNVVLFSSQVTVVAPTTGGTTDLYDDGSAYHVVSSPSVNHGGSITLGLDVAIANADAGAHNTRFYFSTDTTLDGSDYLVGTYPSYGIDLYTSTYGYEDQDIAITNFSSAIPPGTYYVLCSIDATGAVAESNEGNNLIALNTLVTVSPAPSSGGGGGGGCTLGATTGSLLPIILTLFAMIGVRLRRRN